ncbi:MAG: helix-turn-helix domain-containing protein [Acidimicrobiales bacterium]
MALAFRNLNVSPDDSVTEWHLEGIQAALERGDLFHWRKIAAEVRNSPWGQVAQELEDTLSFCRPYGAADVMDAVLQQARLNSAHSERERVAKEVQELTQRSGLSAREFAAHIGTSPSRLSTYMNGKVVPSAAMMVRMRDTVAALVVLQ